MRPDDICLDEGIRIVDRAIDVRLGSEMNNRIDLVGCHDRRNNLGIYDIPLYEPVTVRTFHPFEIR